MLAACTCAVKGTQMAASESEQRGPSILGGTLRVAGGLAFVAVAAATWLSSTTADSDGRPRLASTLSRNVEDPEEYVLIEAFQDDAAEAHVTSDHFKQAQADLPQYVQATPRIRNVTMEGDHWDELGEFRVD